MNAWDVYVGRRCIDTVFYTKDCDAEYVRRSLIETTDTPGTLLYAKEFDMGLDQFLNARRYLSFQEEELGLRLAKEFPELDGLPVKEVIVEAAYWRKANAIHGWFVRRVQEGQDDCGRYSVSREQLKELRDLILEVLLTQDASRMPPSAGFFFGNLEVNDWYWRELTRTADTLNRLLQDFGDQWSFEYSSSW